MIPRLDFIHFNNWPNASGVRKSNYFCHTGQWNLTRFAIFFHNFSLNCLPGIAIQEVTQGLMKHRSTQSTSAIKGQIWRSKVNYHYATIYFFQAETLCEEKWIKNGKMQYFAYDFRQNWPLTLKFDLSSQDCVKGILHDSLFNHFSKFHRYLPVLETVIYYTCYYWQLFNYYFWQKLWVKNEIFT